MESDKRLLPKLHLHNLPLLEEQLYDWFVELIAEARTSLHTDFDSAIEALLSENNFDSDTAHYIIWAARLELKSSFPWGVDITSSSEVWEAEQRLKGLHFFAWILIAVFFLVFPIRGLNWWLRLIITLCTFCFGYIVTSNSILNKVNESKHVSNVAKTFAVVIYRAACEPEKTKGLVENYHETKRIGNELGK